MLAIEDAVPFKERFGVCLVFCALKFNRCCKREDHLILRVKMFTDSDHCQYDSRNLIDVVNLTIQLMDGLIKVLS